MPRNNRSIRKNLEFEIYKENFKFMKNIPFVKNLIVENEKLEKENSSLKTIISILVKKLFVKEQEELEKDKFTNENVTFEIIKD
jgi:hypothetical protein